MRLDTTTQKILEDVVDRCKELHRKGKVADYIPELAKTPPEIFSLSVMDSSGNFGEVGDRGHFFTMQSVSKVVSLLLGIETLGTTEVFRHVGQNPTADPFNSIMRLEMTMPHKPQNPLINSGAIVVTSLLPYPNATKKFQAILDFARKLMENPSIEYSSQVYNSEKETGNRNKALAYFLKSVGNLRGDPEEALDAYFKQCSILVTTGDLARLGATLAMGGISPVTGDRLLSKKSCTVAMALMVTCGLYDGSGEFAVRVGIPAKSGVGGGILGAVPRRMGLGVCGPALDTKGNSVSGVAALERLSRELDLRVF